MTRGPRALLALFLLVAVSAWLGLRIQNEMNRSPEMPVIDGQATADGGTAPAQAIEIPEMPKYVPPPIERFAAALDRPLFNPDRRPAAGEPAAPAPQAQALTATLQGILFASSGSVALLTAVGEDTPVRVSQGEVFLGWRLVAIHADSVVFERDGETVTLELIYRAQPSVEPTRQRARQQP